MSLECNKMKSPLLRERLRDLWAGAAARGNFIYAFITFITFNSQTATFSSAMPRHAHNPHTINTRIFCILQIYNLMKE